MSIVMFGAGDNLIKCYEMLKTIGADKHIVAICDNNKQGQSVELDKKKGIYKILSVEEAITKWPKAIYWITPRKEFRTEMVKQLIGLGIPFESIQYLNTNSDLLSRAMDYRFYKQETDSYVTAFIPLELCYTADIEMVPYHKENKWKYIYNSPIMKKNTLLNMYRMFMNGRAYDVNPVLQEYERRKASVQLSNIQFEYLDSIEKFAEHEYWHFHQMNERLAKGDLAFFASIAPEATFDYQNRVFNMHDGTHRAILFYLHGFRHIPLRITKKDYAEFINEEALKEVNNKFDVCMRDEIDEIPEHAISVGSFSLKFIYTPILHPQYYDLFVSRESYYQSRMDLLNEFFTYVSFNNISMIDFGSNLSYIPQNFARQGALCDCIEYVKERADLAKALTKLYGLDHRVKVHNISLFDYNPEKTYEIGLVLAIYDHWSTKINSEGRDFLNVVDRLVDKMLIWESGNNPETEKKNIIKYTKFKKYVKISNTFGTGKCRELGVFFVPEYEIQLNFEA